MNKTTLFMSVTAIISTICFNFNKIIDHILMFTNENLYDDSVIPYGPYMKTKPINVELVMIDEHIFTNKMNLLLNWKWNFDISGITMSDILLLKPDAKILVLQYTKKYSKNTSQTHTIKINITDNTIFDNDTLSEILFGEICLLT